MSTRTYDQTEHGSHGFTLLELLVSVGVVGLVSVVLSQTFFATTRTNTKTELLQDVKQNGDYAMDIIGRMIRNARSVTSLCSASGSTDILVTIVNPDYRFTTFSCVLDSGVTRIASVSASSTVYVTSSNLTLGSSCTTAAFSATCTKPEGQPAIVTVSYILSQKGTPQYLFERASVTFQSSFGLRN